MVDASLNINSMIRLLREIDTHPIDDAIDLLKRISLTATIFVCGNGGSWSTAQHLACDLSKNVDTHYKAVALGQNMATTTAYANDNGYKNIFVEPLNWFCNPGDVLIAISTSGESKNVVKAAKFAYRYDMAVISMTGNCGNPLTKYSHIAIKAPQRSSIEQIEDLHSIVCHTIVRGLKTS